MRTVIDGSYKWAPARVQCIMLTYLSHVVSSKKGDSTINDETNAYSSGDKRLHIIRMYTPSSWELYTYIVYCPHAYIHVPYHTTCMSTLEGLEAVIEWDVTDILPRCSGNTAPSPAHYGTHSRHKHTADTMNSTKVQNPRRIHITPCIVSHWTASAKDLRTRCVYYYYYFTYQYRYIIKKK